MRRRLLIVPVLLALAGCDAKQEPPEGSGAPRSFPPSLQVLARPCGQPPNGVRAVAELTRQVDVQHYSETYAVLVWCQDGTNRYIPVDID